MIEVHGTTIIGVDTGYGFVKTANTVFLNGVRCLGKAEPSLTENSLFYDGQYYKIGEERDGITETKTDDSNARLLMLVAVAKELKRIGRTSAEIVLAVGLPFTNFGAEKYDVINYYNEYPELKFVYEGISYHVVISKTICLPQCYAAIASRLQNMLEADYLAVDVGSKTTDIVMVKKGRPIESQSATIELAMVKWIRKIQAQLQAQYSKDVPEDEILKVLLNENTLISSEYIVVIREKMKELLEQFELELRERGYNLDFVNVIYVGGGALIAKNYAKSNKSNYMYDCDIKANAKGYEYLASTMISKAGGSI